MARSLSRMQTYVLAGEGVSAQKLSDSFDVALQQQGYKVTAGSFLNPGFIFSFTPETNIPFAVVGPVLERLSAHYNTDKIAIAPETDLGGKKYMAGGLVADDPGTYARRAFENRIDFG